MRPLKLKLAGLRSYLSEVEIDFTDVNLMAIVGDTGAGKSSLLEALCFALYGACTWNAGSGKALVADGGDGTLRVELTFQAKGKTWRVTRTNSVGTYPPAIHQLEGLDDNSRFDNAAPVNKAIENLVGLKHSAFLKAVVLPQGRFQELLHTREADRTAILKDILGLDQITEVRKEATRLHERLQPLLEKTRLHRARLLPDPAGTINDATQRLDAATKRGRQLEQVQRAVENATQAVQAATDKAAEYRAAARNLSTRIPADTAQKYDRLIDLATGLASDLAEVETELDLLEDKEGDLKRILARADAEGTGMTQATEAAATLASVLGQLPGIAGAEHHLSGQRAAIAEDRAKFDRRAHDREQLAEQAQLAQNRTASAQETRDSAEQEHGRCATLLNNARLTLDAVSAAEQKGVSARAELRRRTLEAGEAEQTAEQARIEFETAEQHLATVQRADAAAHAASASGPGDPCPICIRPLPTDFVAPSTTETKQASSARTTAQRRAKAMDAKHAVAAAALKTGQATVETAAMALETARTAHREKYAAAREVLPELDLDQNDATVLTAVQTAVNRADDELQKAVQAATVAQRALDEHDIESVHLQRALTDRETGLVVAQQDLDQRREKVADTQRTVPAAYRIDGDLHFPELDQSLQRARLRRDELRALAQELDTVQEQLKQAGIEKQRLDDDHRSTIDEPADQLGRRFEIVAEHILDTVMLAEFPPAPERPVPSTLAGDARWAASVLASAKAIVNWCADAAAAQDRLAESFAVDAAQKLEEADVADQETLRGLLVEAASDARIAERDRSKAVTEQPLCAELDHRISSAAPAVDSLHELAALLADGKFVATVVKRRQRALLGIASELFQSMTRSRFAFFDDFRVVDNQTGQPREVKTLSGGETFLASLALALALVELTARGGGRVEALFLDEGFGSLDTNVLSEALDALAHQAGGGRLVAVISHMRAVAENVDDVLLVTKALGGSQARWLTSAERNQAITDELVTGLLE
ncbi:AAA family ATPase [Crossiella sp. CA198]|uniref:AAA family ATPase n=1 Tax=Crossiella sp. CA198 TaxID=3455607 RepID=UPI003F8D0A46